jgi:hypothetical protein
MRSNDKQNHRFALTIFLLLWALWNNGCGTHDGRSVAIQRTINELQANATSLDSYDSDEGRSYTAPAFRRAISLLKTDGAHALPRMLTATFSQGYYDSRTKVIGSCYAFSWLQLEDDVRGFYLRSEREPDHDVYPFFSKKPQVPNTAWMVTGGPVLVNKEELAKVSASLKEAVVILDARVLAQKKVVVGLILVNGRKTEPVPAYFRPGPPG